MQVMNSLRLSDGEDYISSAEISSVVQEMGDYYTELYKDAEQVHAIVLMNGAQFFGADLIRAIRHPNILVDRMRPKSMDGTETTGKVQILEDPLFDFAGGHVLLIEDIIDKGLTLSKVTERLRNWNPASLAVASMLEKPEMRWPDTELDADDTQVGIRIANAFVVGYGLDWNEKYRHLPHITKAVETEPGVFAPLIADEDLLAA